MNTIRNTMNKMLRLSLTVACGLMLGASLPVMANPAPPGQGNPHEAVWDDWQPLAEGYVARRRVPARLDRPVAERRSPVTQERARPGRDRRPWERLAIWFHTDAPGLYRVSLDDLAAATGIGANQLHGAANSGRLSVQNGGQAVAWHYDKTHRQVLFAGETYATFHAEGNAYQLRQTQTPDSQRMAERRNPRFQGTGQLTPFRDSVRFEEEQDMMFLLWLEPSSPDARYWFWDYLQGSARPQIQVALRVPNPAAHGAARLRVRLHGFTNLYPGDDHRVVARLNGVEVGDLAWDGLKAAELVLDFDQSLLDPDGDNTLSLHSLHDATRRFPGQLLESIEIEYARLPVAENGQLWMRNVARGAQVVTGFASSEIQVIESPVRNAVLRHNVHVYPYADGWAVAFEATPGSDYLIAEASALPTPVFDAREQTDLTARSHQADYLIIAPREFSETAQALADYRQGRHGVVKIAWLDDIYKAFSAGRVDPFAIGRFMNHVRRQWAQAPSVVMLVGKGSLDRKNRMGYGDNFLPVLMTANPWALAASDARLLGVANGITPFAYGRLPITNDAEGLAYIDKLVAHELGPRGAGADRAVVVADNPDSGGNFHADADRLIAQLLGRGFAPVTPLYHPTHAVRTNLIQPATWESGFVSYSGHGSHQQIGNHRENFINANDAVMLRNNTLPVFAALTCAAGSDDLPGVRSLAAALVLNPAGGAIASLAPSGNSLNADAHTLASAFVDHFYGIGYSTVGSALAGAKQETRNQINEFMAPLYSVIGDPAVHGR